MINSYAIPSSKYTYVVIFYIIYREITSVDNVIITLPTLVISR